MPDALCMMPSQQKMREQGAEDAASYAICMLYALCLISYVLCLMPYAFCLAHCLSMLQNRTMQEEVQHMREQAVEYVATYAELEMQQVML
jgi:hypothetical protein